MYATYSESDLIVPALDVISRYADGVTTGDLLIELRRQLKPSGNDLELLANRNDDKFSQKVRNLKSHDTMEKQNLAIFIDSKYYITEEGKRFVTSGKEILESLRRQGFNENQRKSAIDRKYENIVIEEGEKFVAGKTVFRRSAVLRRAALKQYSDASGSIACVGCGFQAELIYGSRAKGLIEFHHTEPLFLNKGKSAKANIAEALKKIVPLCPNCHRVVHRDSSRCLPIDELKNILSTHENI